MSDVRISRRRAGLAILGTSLLALALLFVALPPPTDYEEWIQHGKEPRGSLLVARGPAIARYDAQEDLTFAVFECAHGYCPTAATLRGDAREAVAQPSVTLFAAAPISRDTEPLGEPIRAESSVAGTSNITSTSVARFEIGRAWLPLALYQITYVGIAVGAALSLRQDQLGGIASALGAALGIWMGTIFAGLGDFILGPILAILAVGAGIAGIFAGRRWPAAARVACFLLALGVALVAAEALARQFLAHDPTR